MHEQIIIDIKKDIENLYYTFPFLSNADIREFYTQIIMSFMNYDSLINIPTIILKIEMLPNYSYCPSRNVYLDENLQAMYKISHMELRQKLIYLGFKTNIIIENGFYYCYEHLDFLTGKLILKHLNS